MVAGPGEPVSKESAEHQNPPHPEGSQLAPSAELQPSAESRPLKWSEVLGRPQPKEDTPFYQVKKERAEARIRQEAVVSPEVIDLVQENLIELAYLVAKVAKKQDSLPSEFQSLGKILQSIDPEFGEIQSLELSELLERCQKIIERLMSDEQKRGQLVALGLSYQEHKLDILRRAYGIEIVEEGKDEREAAQQQRKEEEEKREEARRKLRRNPTLLVIDTEGNIIPQPVEMSREDFINANLQNQPVPFWRRIFGDVKSYQRKKAGEEWDRAKAALEKLSEERPTEIKIRVDFGRPMQLTEQQENFLKQLGFLGENERDGERLKDEVVRKLMAQVRETLTLRREVWSVTGVPGEQLIENLLNLESPPPDLTKLEQRVQDQIEKEQKEAQQRVVEELKGVIISGDINILKKERERAAGELEELRERRQREEKKPQINCQTIYDALPEHIKAQLIRLKIPFDEEGTIATEPKPPSDKLGSLLEEIEKLEERIDEIKKLEAELQRFQQLIREDERTALQYIPHTKEVTNRDQNGNVETTSRSEEAVEMLEIIRGRIKEMQEKIDNEIMPRIPRKKEQSDLEMRLKRLNALMTTKVTIGEQELTLKEWLEQMLISESSPSASGNGTSEHTEDLRKKLGYLDVLIEYSSEEKLKEIGERLIQTVISDNVIEELLGAVRRQNLKLSSIIETIGDEEKKPFLRYLYIIFGREALLPASGSPEQQQEQRERAEKMIYFLEFLTTKRGKKLTEVISDGFPQEISDLIKIEVEEINSPKSTKQVGNPS